jgi:hypothetical protein
MLEKEECEDCRIRARTNMVLCWGGDGDCWVGVCRQQKILHQIQEKKWALQQVKKG